MTFRESEMLARIGWIYKLRVSKAEADRSRADAKLARKGRLMVSMGSVCITGEYQPHAQHVNRQHS
jgi:hypothetical protein